MNDPPESGPSNRRIPDPLLQEMEAYWQSHAIEIASIEREAKRIVRGPLLRPKRLPSSRRATFGLLRDCAQVGEEAFAQIVSTATKEVWLSRLRRVRAGPLQADDCTVATLAVLKYARVVDGHASGNDYGQVDVGKELEEVLADTFRAWFLACHIAETLRWARVVGKGGKLRRRADDEFEFE